MALAAALVACHTAGEVFFDALLLRLAWEEITHFNGSVLTQDEVVDWFSSRTPLSTRLRTSYHVRLHGGWDADRPENPISEWTAKVARVRNRIVHGGYRPTEQEASEALAALDAVELYVLDLIARDRNRTRYPRTVFMMLGEVGMRRRGVYNGQIRRTIEAAPANWVQSFYAFQRRVSDQIVAAI